VPKQSNNLLFERKHPQTPLSVVVDDLRGASIPQEYFRSLVRGNIGSSSVSDLRPSGLPKDVIAKLQWFHGQGVYSSLWFDHRDTFVRAATETVICGVGSVAYMTPSSIALAQILNTLRGAPSAVAFVEEVDYLFIDDMVTDHTKRLFDAEPTAAAHFHEFLRLVKYTLNNRIVYCLNGVTPANLQEQLSLTYTDSLVDLINGGLGYVGSK
jgi:hypothetical protein